VRSGDGMLTQPGPPIRHDWHGHCSGQFTEAADGKETAAAPFPPVEEEIVMAVDKVIKALAAVGKANAKAAWFVAKCAAKVAKKAATGGKG